MADLAVALLDGGRLAAPLGDRLGVEVVATTPADHLDEARRLAGRVTLVVGVARVPWPARPDLHAEGSAEVPGYTGVVSWHGLPALADRLAEAVAPGVGAGAHLLVTAPDPGADTEPEDLMFLREIAAAVEARVSPPSRSIAWRGDTRTPTAVEALRTVVEAHGRTDVVECPVAPGSGADPDLSVVAEEVGARLTCADLGQQTLLGLLAGVVTTVAAHEEEVL